MARATTAARRLLSFVRPGADAEPDRSEPDHRDTSAHGSAVPPRPPAPEPVPPRDHPVFEVPAPVLGETCELDADAIEFPNPAVADFVPDLSRPRAAAFKQERTPREVPARSEVPVPVLEVDPARPEPDEAPTLHEVDHVVGPALPVPALAGGGGAVAPVIGAICELDPDHVEFPHPAVASFVPVEGRRRGAFGAGAVPEPSSAPEPVPVVLPAPDPEPVVAPEREPVVVPEPEPVVAPETVPAPVVEPEPPTAPEPLVAPVPVPVPVPHRPSPPSVFPEPVVPEPVVEPEPPASPATDPDKDHRPPADTPPAPVAASAHQWYGARVDAQPRTSPRGRRRALVIGAGIGAAVLVVGGVLVAVPLLTQDGDDGAAPIVAAPGTTEAAVAWVASSLDPDSVLLVEDALVPDITGAGFPGDTVVSESTITAAAPDSAWRAADYVLATPAFRASASGEAETALANSETVAAFGSGGSVVEVRRVLDEGIDRAAAAAAVLTAARASAGGQLAANPALSTTPAARALLEEGRVDARLLLLLGQQLASAPLSVAVFPIGPNETDGVRRLLVLSGYNGADVPADPTATAEATTWLGSQSGEFVPSSVESTLQGLLVTLDLDEPTGLLPGAP